MSDLVVKTVEELKGCPEEYREAVSKLVISHAINELYGAQVFDEPAIAYAPTPYAKWLTCRVAMEEYGHHVRFKQLGQQMGIPEERMIPGTGKKPLSIFEFPLKTWEEFVAIKLLADLAEILQVEDLLHCTFHPLRNLGNQLGDLNPRHDGVDRRETAPHGVRRLGLGIVGLQVARPAVEPQQDDRFIFPLRRAFCLQTQQVRRA